MSGTMYTENEVCEIIATTITACAQEHCNDIPSCEWSFNYAELIKRAVVRKPSFGQRLRSAWGVLVHGHNLTPERAP